MGNETRPQPKEPEHLNCQQCMKEVPASTAITAEGEEYLMHFCGLECMTQWRHAGADDDKSKDESK